MNKSTTAEIEHRSSSDIDHSFYGVPKRNHDTLMHLNKQFGGIIKNYGVAYSVFRLNKIGAPMEDIANIAKTISATEDDQIWMKVIFYRDRKRKNEVAANMKNDERMGAEQASSLESSVALVEYKRI